MTGKSWQTDAVLKRLSNSKPQSQTDSSLSLLSLLQSERVPRLLVHDYSEIQVPSFNRSATGMVDFRAERALVMAQEKDLVVVGGAIDFDFLQYLTQLKVGPESERVIVCDNQGCTSEPLLQRVTRPEHMEVVKHFTADQRAFRLNTFYYGEGSEKLLKELRRATGYEVHGDGGPPWVTEFSNEKHRLREAALRCGVPVAPGEYVDITGLGSVRGARAIHAALSRLPTQTDGAIIRGCFSGGGFDNLVLRGGTGKVEAWLQAREHLEQYLVESLLEFQLSPNVQLWIDDTGVCSVLGTTNQRLDGTSAHIGNEFSMELFYPPALKQSSLALGAWLGDMGYRGPLGMDFLVPGSATAGDDHCFVEVNGRINGATYMIALFERINQVRHKARREKVSAWISTKELKSSAGSFRELSELLSDLLYTHGERVWGVVPYNSGLLSRGKISFLILGNQLDECFDLEKQLTGR